MLCFVLINSVLFNLVIFMCFVTKGRVATHALALELRICRSMALVIRSLVLLRPLPGSESVLWTQAACQQVLRRSWMDCLAAE